MNNQLSRHVKGNKIINNVVVGGYGTEILNCASAWCKCGRSLGIPEEELTDELVACNIVCPLCGFKITLYCSKRSVWKGFKE